MKWAQKALYVAITDPSLRNVLSANACCALVEAVIVTDCIGGMGEIGKTLTRWKLPLPLAPHRW